MPVSVFSTYQISKWLPYFFRRYVCFDKRATLEPLYKLEGVSGERTHAERGH